MRGHFDLPKARRDSPAHHLRALAWGCAAICIIIAVVNFSIVAVAFGERSKPLSPCHIAMER